MKKDQWIDWILAPLKFYVVLAVPFYLIFCIVLKIHPIEIQTGENAYKLHDAISILLYGYMACAPCLLFGGVFQIISGNSGSAIRTLVVAAVPTALLLFYLFMHVVQYLL